MEFERSSHRDIRTSQGEAYDVYRAAQGKVWRAYERTKSTESNKDRLKGARDLWLAKIEGQRKRAGEKGKSKQADLEKVLKRSSKAAESEFSERFMLPATLEDKVRILRRMQRKVSSDTIAGPAQEMGVGAAEADQQQQYYDPPLQHPPDSLRSPGTLTDWQGPESSHYPEGGIYPSAATFANLGDATSSARHIERKLKKVTQSRGHATDVVQMYATLGDFSNANSQSARALDAVMRGLSRNASETFTYYERDPKTTLKFRTEATGPDREGCTTILAHVAGQWYGLDDICSPNSQVYPLGLQLKSDTHICIDIVIDPAQHNVPPHNRNIMATLAHEINAHAIYVKPWLQKLRGGGYTAQGIRTEWQISNQPGALNHLDTQHQMFASGSNYSYNQMVRNIAQTVPAWQRRRFQNDVRADMEEHALSDEEAYDPFLDR